MCVTVVHCKRDQFDKYIGRGSRWGNPFHIGKDGTREEVIAKYKLHFWNKIQSDEKFASNTLGLVGLKLGCYCAPLPCHGDVIKAYLEWRTR